MTDCAHVREDLGGYVLGALEPAERDAVRAHVAQCAPCSHEHAQLAELPELLDLLPADDSPREAPTPALEERVLDRFARESRRPSPAPTRPRMRLRVGPRAAMATALAAAALAGAGGALLIEGRGERVEYYSVALRPEAAAPGANARATLWRTSGGTRVRLRVGGLPPDPGIVYELLCERSDGSAASAGTFRVDGDGRAEVILTTAARIGEYERLRVVRRAGGLSGAERPADVLAGRVL